MTTTLSSPNTATLGMDGAASLTIAMFGKATIAFTSANDDVWPSFTVTNAQSKTYGPYGINMSVVITALDGSLAYQVNGGVPGLGYDADSNITSVVDADGNALMFATRPAGGYALVAPDGTSYSITKDKYNAIMKYAGHYWLAGSSAYEGNRLMADGTGSLAAINDYIGYVRDAVSKSNPITATQNTTAFKPQLLSDGTRLGWKFDGIAQRLALTTEAFDPNADCFMVMAYKMPATTIAVSASVIGAGDTGPNTRWQYFFSGSNAGIWFMRDAASTVNSITMPALAVNSLVVSSIRLSSGVFYARQRSDLAALSSSSTAKTITLPYLYPMRIGSGYSAAVSRDFWMDSIFGFVSGNGSMSLAEITEVEDMVAEAAKITLV